MGGNLKSCNENDKAKICSPAKAKLHGYNKPLQAIVSWCKLRACHGFKFLTLCALLTQALEFSCHLCVIWIFFNRCRN